jgi:hypothetical protein
MRSIFGQRISKVNEFESIKNNKLKLMKSGSALKFSNDSGLLTDRQHHANNNDALLTPINNQSLHYKTLKRSNSFQKLNNNHPHSTILSNNEIIGDGDLINKHMRHPKNLM